MRFFAGIMLATLTLPIAGFAVQSSAPGDRAKASQVVCSRVDQIFDQLAADADIVKARSAALTLFDQVMAHCAQRDIQSFVQAAFAVRLVRLLSGAEQSDRGPLLDCLRENPRLALTLLYLVQFGQENPADLCAALNHLRQQRASLLETYANLAAAVCVVHDRPLERRINENTVAAPDLVRIFDYYRIHERRMLFGIRRVPAAVLVYVVDSTASIPQMQWALDMYGGDTNVGSRFFDIKYDYEHFRTGAPKQVTQRGLTLPNIHRYGGVCADQAYFAMSVGKAIGVPTAFVVGYSAQMGHAWVGFLQAKSKKQAVWNFNTGRYDAYRAVRGVVVDPQTRKAVPDGYVSLMAELIGSRASDRHAAAAYTDAVQRLSQIAKSGDPFEPPQLIEGESSAPLRQVDTTAQLALLEHALRLFPGYARGWFTLRDLATTGQLSLDEKQRWASVLQKLCGQKYPDFAVAVLVPMITSIEDIQAQDALWTEAFKRFSRRPDLAAEVRMLQGQMWEQQGDQKRAGMCYEDVIERFANAGPFVIDALKKTEQMLRELGQDEKVLLLYQQAWQRIAKPRDANAEFRRQSTWYKVGVLFASKLKEAGRPQLAKRTLGEIETNIEATGRRVR